MGFKGVVGTRESNENLLNGINVTYLQLDRPLTGGEGEIEANGIHGIPLISTPTIILGKRC